MGRGILEGSPRTERLQVETRSSDPADPATVEAWLRIDLTDTDKVGEFRFWDGEAVRSVDVVTPGSTEAVVEEVLRVQTPNGKGVIKTAPRSEAKHPAWTTQHGGSALGLGYTTIPTGSVDNYEPADGDPGGSYGDGETLSDYYSGDVGDYVRSTSNAVEGSYALAYDSSGSSARVIYSAPGDGLSNYPSAGDTVRVFMRAPDFTSFAFGVEPGSGPAGYVALLKDGDMRIRRFDDPSTVRDLTSATPSITGTDWYWAEIQTPSSSDSTVGFDLYQLNTSDLSRGTSIDSLSTSDPNYTGEGVGARTGTNGLDHTAIDGIKVI